MVRRRYRNWELEGSYTWSEARGQAEDFDLLLGNEASLRDDESGFLDYDQRHVVKLNVATRAWGLRLGGGIIWQSGLPYSILQAAELGFETPPIYTSRRLNALRSRITDSDPGWMRAQIRQTRGLNRNHNSSLKNIFKGAATTVIMSLPNDPLHQHYVQLMSSGTKPNLAKVTIARRIAAIVLRMWKDEQEYDPGKLKQETVATTVR